MSTPNYSLPIFEPTDNIDLIGVYNAAMTAIDTALKTISDTATTASSTASSASSSASEAVAAVSAIQKIPDSDGTLNVEDIAKAKVTSGGFIYIPEE